MFRQSRIGKGGKAIRIWKLRSMYVDAHEHPEHYLDEVQMIQWKREQKVDDDPRVTRIGKLIRKTSLDEVPQFINVLVGDMSAVGPWPTADIPLPMFARHPHRRSARLSVPERARPYSGSARPSSLPLRSVAEEAASLGVAPLCL